MRGLLASVMLLGMSVTAQAQEHDHAASITIENPWMRSTPPRATSAAIYLIVVNHGPAQDRLVAVASPAAANASLHNSTLIDGIRKMEAIGEVDVVPHQPLRFTPGGQHIMLMGLAESLIVGDSVPLTLTFETFGEITVDVTILAPGETPKDNPHATDHQMEEGDHTMHH